MHVRHASDPSLVEQGQDCNFHGNILDAASLEHLDHQILGVQDVGYGTTIQQERVRLARLCELLHIIYRFPFSGTMFSLLDTLPLHDRVQSRYTSNLYAAHISI